MTIRMRYMELPGEQYVLVVDGVPIGEQDMFAQAFASFSENMRELTDGRCVSGLVFHDRVELPGDPEPLAPLWPYDMEPVPMICDPCKGVRRSTCSVCGSPRAVYNNDKPEAEQSVVVHKNEWERCPGSKKPPVWTHVGCTGCSCQHRPEGSWRGRT